MKIPTSNMATIALLGAAVVLAGCSSRTHYSRSTPAPLYSSSTAMGGTDTGTEFETGAAEERQAGLQGEGEDVVIPLFKEEVQVGTRRVEAGTVTIRKNVKTESINRPVQIREETLTVNRVEGAAADTGQALAPTGRQEQGAPAQQDQNLAGNAFEEKEITIQLYKEEPVVQKRIVPMGQIVAKKQAGQKQVTVQEQVRRDDIQISKSGEAQNVNISQNLRSSLTDQTAQTDQDESIVSDLSEERSAAGAPPTTEGETTGGASSRPITDLSTLSSTTDPSTLMNRPVRLSGSTVQSTMGENWVTLSGQGGTKVYVHSSQPVTSFKSGDQANITGTIKQMPSDPTRLGLDQQSAQELKNQRFYIEATQMQPQNQ